MKEIQKEEGGDETDIENKKEWTSGKLRIKGKDREGERIKRRKDKKG